MAARVRGSGRRRATLARGRGADRWWSASMAEGERPLNLLFITCDQLRRDAVSAMGLGTLPEARTPAMDALAADGTLFTQHITNALPCGPSRTAMLSGLLAMNNRVVQNSTPLAAGLSNWPREFKSMGLDPVLLGHTSTPQDPRGYHPNDPILKQTHSALADFSPLFKSDMHDTSPKAWAAWLEFTHGYTHPGVDELYSGYTPAGSPGGPWLAASQLKEDGSAFYAKEHSDSAFMCMKAKEYATTSTTILSLCVCVCVCVMSAMASDSSGPARASTARGRCTSRSGAPTRRGSAQPRTTRCSTRRSSPRSCAPSPWRRRPTFTGF